MDFSVGQSAVSKTVISTACQDCWVAIPIRVIGDLVSGGVWPVANQAIFVPFTVQDRSVTVYKMGWGNGSPVAGNIDVGIYDFAGTRLVSIGSTAQTGALVTQIVDTVDTVLVPGHYFLAMAKDTVGTGIVQKNSTTAILANASGVQKMETAFPLPATATFANPTAAYVPGITAYVVPTV